MLQSSLRGGLALGVTGLPDGAEARADVTGPGSFAQAVDLPAALQGLEPGAYVVSPVEARAPKVSFAGEEVYAAAEVEVEVERGQTAEVELEYAFAGLDVQDDVGDRTATGGHDYDIVATGYRVVGDHVELYVTLAEGQTDLSVFIAYFDVDADEDPTTGGLGAYEQFCPLPRPPLGPDHVVEVNYVMDTFALVRAGEEPGSQPLPAPVQDGTTLTVRVPLEWLGGATRLNLGVVVGNGGAPTDCNPGPGAVEL